MSDSNALVLGGGGVTGVAWEIGVLLGLQTRGIDLTTAGLMVGTSAGSVVAAQIAGGTALSELYAKQLEPVKKRPHRTLSKVTLLRYGWILWRAKDAADLGARMGRLALAAKTQTEAERRPVFEALLGAGRGWPETDLRITAINANTGALRVFDKSTGASLVDAVCASTAVPGVWPPVTIQGERYIDGGMHSGTHANLAEGRKHVVIIAPLSFGTRVMTSPVVHAERLRAAGARVALVMPDEAAKKSIGRDVLDPQARAQSARAGNEQAARIFDAVAAAWRAAG